MAMTIRSANTVLIGFALLILATMPARADLFSLAASGTISFNSSGDPTIPVGTPWTFELTYDTAAPDLDPDPTNGSFTNTAVPPAMTFFHYRAANYEVTIDDPADFGEFSGIFITFTGINAMDININAPAFFPPLAGGAVSFHADFARFSPPPIFSSDALPTNTALSPDSLDDSNVTLLPPNSVVTGSSLTSLTLTAVSALPGDFDNDGDVDGRDFLAWQRGDSSAPHSTSDLGDWQANYGTLTPAPAESTAVPEPTTLGLLEMVAIGECLIRRRTVPFDARFFRICDIGAVCG